MDEAVARHKREQKELVGQITGLKKQATKKNRKQVLQKCADMEHELNQRHKREIDELNGVVQNDEEEVDMAAIILAQMELKEQETPQEPPQTSIPLSPLPAPKKRNRAKERIAKREAEVQRMKDEAAKEAEGAIDYRQIEHDLMAQLCGHHGLEIKEINPDGHCLFALIQDQLATRYKIEVTVDQLRQKAGDHILAHGDEFTPFLFDETTMLLRAVDSYVNELTTTAMWGSDMEILALARVYECPIEVHQAGADMLVMNGDALLEPLKLGYFKHLYGLGEHYNSLRDVSR